MLFIHERTRSTNKKISENLFSCLDFFMVRSPILPIEVFKELTSYDMDSMSNDRFQNALFKLKQLANNPIIREAITVVSPSLLESLPYLENEKYNKKQQQVLSSLLRYVLRMTTRATPFGICSGVTYGTFGSETKIRLKNSQLHKKRTRADMEWIMNIVRQLESDKEVIKQIRVKINPNLYVLGDRIKIPYTIKNDTIKPRTYSVQLTPVMADIINNAKDFIHFKTLFMKLQGKYPNEPSYKIENYIFQLLDSEVLISELRPPLLDSNPLEYLISKLSGLETNNHLFEQLLTIHSEIKQYDEMKIGEGESKLLGLIEKMRHISNVQKHIQVDLSLVTEEPVKLNHKVKKDLEKAVELLWRFSAKRENTVLKEYRQRFIEKYGFNRLVPLPELVDDETGLGLPRYHQKNSSLTERLKNREILLKQWVTEALVKGKDEIVLDEEKINEFDKTDVNVQKLPDSVELYCTLNKIGEGNDDYLIVIGENPGSDGAGKSFGRFIDMFDNVLKDKWLQIHDFEQKMHPNAVLAEVTCQHYQSRILNVVQTINRRPYEITLGTNSLNKKSRILTVNDLLIGCTEDRFYVTSKLTGKEIIPSTSHMLNHYVAPEVFSFLIDVILENRELLSPVDWGTLSDLPYLPRLRYKNIVLSPARWRMFKQSIHVNFNEEKCTLFEKVSEWRKEWRVPRFIYLTNLDNRILLDLENPLHVNELLRDLKNLKNGESLLLVEPGFSIDDEQLIKENHGTHFIGEFVFSFIKSKSEENIKDLNVKNRVEMLSKKKVISIKERIQPPFGEWLYLKLYNLRSRQDEFIASELRTLVEYLKQKGIIYDSFFVRYFDPESHLRIRFKGETNNLICKCTPIINEKIKLWINKGFINRVVYDTYDPEIERYGGPNLIHLAEEVFMKDSDVVINLISLHRYKKMGYDLDTIGIISVIDIMENFFMGFESQLEWLNASVNFKDFQKEFRAKRDHLLKVANSSDNWRGLRSERDGRILYEIMLTRREAIQKYANALKIAEKENMLYGSIYEVIGSVIHLHLNRLLGVNQERENKIMALARHTLHHLRYFKRNENGEQR
jgi:lantibiotic biosynthesis protein